MQQMKLHSQACCGQDNFWNLHDFQLSQCIALDEVCQPASNEGKAALGGEIPYLDLP